MAKVWDNIMKRMFAANPQHFLNWLTPGAVLVRELSPLLKTRDLEADLAVCDTMVWEKSYLALRISGAEKPTLPFGD